MTIFESRKKRKRLEPLHLSLPRLSASNPKTRRAQLEGKQTIHYLLTYQTQNLFNLPHAYVIKQHTNNITIATT
jgi:hypothetical protein